MFEIIEDLAIYYIHIVEDVEFGIFHDCIQFSLK